VSPWLTLLVGVALAVAAALLLGAITLRMSGHYLPLATIAWGLALNYTMANMEWLGKYDGILGMPPLSCSAGAWAPAAACTRWCGASRCWPRWRHAACWTRAPAAPSAR
jgi:ABC-type branched-subunit amino acid transport system permease subunit